MNAPLDITGLLLHVVGEGPGKRGQDAARRHDPVEMAVFVMDQREWDIGGAKHCKRVHRVHQVGNHGRRTA